MKSGRQNGFTLIELMITVVIIAILSAIAMPAYQEYVKRGNRAAAESEMMDIASREQQYLLANRCYTDLATLGYTLPSNLNGKYTPGIGGTVTAASCQNTMPNFTITFIAAGIQASDGNLVLTSEGVKSRAGDPLKW